MDRRRELTEAYKERKIIGGIYRVTNSRTGMYMLEHTQNLQAKRNSFDFMVSSGTCFHHKLQVDWADMGASVFTFEVLAELEKKPDQSQPGFIVDLETLAQMWADKLDPAKRY